MRTGRLGKALAAQERRAQFANDGARMADIGIVGEQFERVVEPCAGLQQQGKIAGEVVTSARPGWPKTPSPVDAEAARVSSTVSIGNSRRYSMRAATSVAFGADSLPWTISPVCVSAR